MNDSANEPVDSSADSPSVDWLCFAYLTAERAEIYRAVIEAFAAAKAEFSLHLRPAEVRAGLQRQGISLELADVESALQQLEAWGNLQSYQDNADVASLTDYYRKRLLYQLSAGGEAAHASTLTFTERLGQQAKLDARALERIADGVGQLQRLVGTPPHDDAAPVDSVVALTTLRTLCQDADELTSRAQSFFRWLHEQTESDRGDLEAFLAYKERLIDYLQQFVSELITRGGEIAERLDSIDDAGFSALAEAAAREEVGEPRVGEESGHAQRLRDAAARWQHRLAGLCGWFTRRSGRPPQSDQLRAAARAAIPRLLQLAGQINERQSGRSDRVADLKTLARQFLSCRDDAEAHRLFRAAFAISPARHLRVDQTTIEQRDQQPVRPSTSWFEAEPVEFAPQLRATGRMPSASANRRIVDRSEQRSAAKRRLNREAGRGASSRETLIALGRCRLSEIGQLDRDSFRLLLELIEQAVPAPTVHPASGEEPIHATSRDGTVRIELGPVPPAERRESEENFAYPIATVATAGGDLSLADRWMEVTRVR